MKFVPRSFVVGFLLALFLLAFLALSPLVGRYAERGAPNQSECKFEKDLDSSFAHQLRSARESRHNGNLEAADAEYRHALESSNSCIRTAAASALDRSDQVHKRFGPSYELVSAASSASFRLRAPLLAILVLFLLARLAAFFIPRRGIRVTEFPVFGSPIRPLASSSAMPSCVLQTKSAVSIVQTSLRPRGLPWFSMISKVFPWRKTTVSRSYWQLLETPMPRQSSVLDSLGSSSFSAKLSRRRAS
jgi:hypothetical protein